MFTNVKTTCLHVTMTQVKCPPVMTMIHNQQSKKNINFMIMYSQCDKYPYTTVIFNIYTCRP